MNALKILKYLTIAIEMSKQIPGLIDALRQTSELSPKDEADLDALIASLKSKPHWQVEKPTV